MRVAVVGQGYVGVTGAVSLARQGHQVCGVEQDADRLRPLALGRAPVEEPGLQQELALAVETGRLRFTESLVCTHARQPFDVVVIAVGTPPQEDGSADLSQVRTVLSEVATLVPAPYVVLKSTVPPGTSEMLLAEHPTMRPRYAYNPEFLNQGSALDDWAAPSRIVAGVCSEPVIGMLRELYGLVACPWVVTTPTSAEMAKYVSNTFLAVKISFSNEVARLCTTPEVNIDDVLCAAGADPRIGSAFLQPGLGFGDSCLPKDTAALQRWAAARDITTPVLDAVIAVNRAQPRRVLEALREELGDGLAQAEVAVLGARYEPWSDDMRAAPSLSVIPELVTETAAVRVWEPAMDSGRLEQLFPGVRACPDMRSALRGARAVVVLTEWPQIIEADWAGLATELAAPAVIVDGKNCLQPGQMAGLPVTYRSTGNRVPARISDSSTSTAPTP
ncbi:UDP-glucose dehydrogenase family protein [Streptomyces sp. MMBL 11-3]|uniref:UDP-glucose dehydrogenase family protein n=1 Tax=Streptomyces sp. MMBL 11-3 TaxID=3382639 RepID=UPI0039B69B92